jgi:hypothetical protein
MGSGINTKNIKRIAGLNGMTVVELARAIRRHRVQLETRVKWKSAPEWVEQFSGSTTTPRCLGHPVAGIGRG